MEMRVFAVGGYKLARAATKYIPALKEFMLFGRRKTAVATPESPMLRLMTLTSPMRSDRGPPTRAPTP